MQLAFSEKVDPDTRFGKCNGSRCNTCMMYVIHVYHIQKDNMHFQILNFTMYTTTILKQWFTSSEMEMMYPT